MFHFSKYFPEITATTRRKLVQKGKHHFSTAFSFAQTHGQMVETQALARSQQREN
jgi:hypothetical protein